MSTIVDFPLSGVLGDSVLPARWDLDIYQGDTLELLIQFKDASSTPVNLSGFSGIMEIKNGHTGPVLMQPTVTVQYLSTNGLVRCYQGDTSGLDTGEYMYDLQLTDSSGRARTFLGGKVVVTSDVSQ